MGGFVANAVIVATLLLIINTVAGVVFYDVTFPRRWLSLVLMLASMLHGIGVGNMLASVVRVVCIDNSDYPASLELWKIYRILPDREGQKHGLVRVIDESGEDYLFPDAYFVRVELPRTVERVLRKIA